MNGLAKFHVWLNRPHIVESRGGEVRPTPDGMRERFTPGVHIVIGEGLGMSPALLYDMRISAAQTASESALFQVFGGAARRRLRH
ncbi:MAG: hypothetical protein R3E83_19790 [Burkholderiaceae bacterium]